METFGDKLRDLRKRRKLSQIDAATDLAEIYDIRMSQTTLSALEQRATPPKAEIVEVLADYFKVSPDFFKLLDGQVLKSAMLYLKALREEQWSPNFYGDFCGENDPSLRSIRAGRIHNDEYDEDEFFDF